MNRSKNNLWCNVIALSLVTLGVSFTAMSGTAHAKLSFDSFFAPADVPTDTPTDTGPCTFSGDELIAWEGQPVIPLDSVMIGSPNGDVPLNLPSPPLLIHRPADNRQTLTRRA